jgi:transcriptional regulator with XRE-family HTH domain
MNYTLKPGQGVVIQTVDSQGMPKFETLQASHPSFKRVVRALKRKEWAKVPKLIDIAQSIADLSCGQVELRKDGIFYKGTQIDNSLTTRILELMRQGKSVNHMLRFMDNLFQNPQQYAIHELYDWLKKCNLPITDRGTFMAYKRVRSDYKDCYSGTIDNSVGQIVFMKREDVDPDRRNECSQGLHFCSAAYLPNYPGDKIMKVEINPKDVVAIPADYSFSKGRTWLYEVVEEIPANQYSSLVDRGIDIEDYQVAVYSVAKDRKKLIADILALPTIKSMLRKAKNVKKTKRGRKAKTMMFVVSERSIRKMTYGRLRKLHNQFAEPPIPKMSRLSENRLEEIRKAYGLSRGEVAEHLGISYRKTADIELSKNLTQQEIDSYLDAIMAAAGLGATKSTGVSFPKPTQKRAKAAAASASSSFNDDFEDDEEPWSESYDDGYADFDEEEEEEAFN